MINLDNPKNATKSPFCFCAPFCFCGKVIAIGKLQSTFNEYAQAIHFNTPLKKHFALNVKML